MHEPDLIDHYVFGLWRRLSLKREVTERILEEVEGHLRASAESDAQSGSSLEDSQRLAIGSFGSLDEVADRFRATYRTSPLTRFGYSWPENRSMERVAFVATLALIVRALIPWNEPWGHLNTSPWLSTWQGWPPLALVALLVGAVSGALFKRWGGLVGSTASAMLMVSPMVVFAHNHAWGIHLAPVLGLQILNVWPDSGNAVLVLGNPPIILTTLVLLIVLGYAGAAVGRRVRSIATEGVFRKQSPA